MEKDEILKFLGKNGISRAGRLGGFVYLFFLQTLASRFYNMQGYFTSVVQMLSSFRDASVSGKAVICGRILCLYWLSVPAKVLMASIVDCTIFLKNELTTQFIRRVPWCLADLSFQVNKPFAYK